ncbi:MAG: 16S rRNA processing protein RimM [Acidobacteria bacterium]|nr:16S rRNA processing protein RimM [Acidobacteriota bacterium]
MTADDLILVGRVARSHGIRGQVIVNPDTDFAVDRFREGSILLVGSDARPRKITAAHFHKGRPVIGLEGVETMSDAERLVGSELKVPATQIPALPEGTFHRHELVGCVVHDTEGRVVGEVAAVEGPIHNSRLVINAPHGEVLIPLVADICVEIEPRQRRIGVKLPDGLIELNTRGARG